MKIGVRVPLCLSMALAACPAVLAEQSFRLSIDAPGRVEGAPGSTVRVDASVRLTSSNDDEGVVEGAQGWSISVAVSGGTLAAIAIKGVTVDTLFDEDEDPSTALASVPLDLGTADFKVAQKAVGVAPLDPTVAGGVSAIVLNNTIKRVLSPNGSQVIARLSIDVAVPEEGCSSLGIQFLSGLKGAGQPVKNVVTFGGASIDPTLQNSTVEVCAPQPRFEFVAVPDGIPVEVLPDGTRLARPEVVIREGTTPSLELDVLVRLISDAKAPEGPQGWSVSMASDACLELLSQTIKGVTVNTLFDEDEDPTSPLAEVPLDLGTADFKVAQKATGDYAGSTIPGTSGVVSAIVLNNTIKRVLLGSSDNEVLRVRLRYSSPIAEGPNAACNVRFLDGLKGAGQPVKNVATVGGQSKPPELHNLIIEPVGVPVRQDNYIRGNANDDAKVDIGDAVWIVQAVALGGLPVTCPDAGDANDDEALDLVDAIFLIDYLFRGGSVPTQPFPGCGSDDDSSPEKCPSGSTASCAP